MTRSVRHTDGIEISLATGETLTADSKGLAGDINVLSHAHGDHLYRTSPGSLVCSETTAALANVRRGDDSGELARTTHPNIELVNAGHVAGSRAALIDDGDRTYLYTDDIATRNRCYLRGFEPPTADVLIVESTYGKPAYVFPEQDSIEAEIVDWLDDTYETPLLLFGYSLGRAQKLQRLVQRSDRSRLFVTESIDRINRVLEETHDISFHDRRYRSETELSAGDVLVLPMQTNNLSFVNSIVENTGAIKAGFSGWAVDESFKYRGGYDVTFPLSDHCDFNELLEVVDAVDPEIVYTNHGFADDFANHVVAKFGITAQSLKKNQSTLSEF